MTPQNRLTDAFSSNLRWAVLQTKPGEWERAQGHLARQGFRVAAPRLREHRGRKVTLAPMFPGYLFLELEPRSKAWQPALSTRGVLRLLGPAKDRPSLLPRGWVEGLLAQGGIFDVFLDALAFHRGDLVEVVDGPFKGLRGRCEWTGKDRVAILLNMLGRQSCVYSAPELLKVVGKARVNEPA